MTPAERTIAAFESKLHQVVLRFQELKQENASLTAQLVASRQEKAQLEAQLAQVGRDYDSLKTARMMAITDGDLTGAKERLARLIREVNKCIAILNHEE